MTDKLLLALIWAKMSHTVGRLVLEGDHVMSQSKSLKSTGSGVDVTYVTSGQFARMSAKETPATPQLQRMFASRRARLRAN